MNILSNLRLAELEKADTPPQGLWKRARALATRWAHPLAGAVCADKYGRGHSVAMAHALLEWGFTEEQAECFYYSNHMRYFYDFYAEYPRPTEQDLRDYLKRNRVSIWMMFRQESIRTFISSPDR